MPPLIFRVVALLIAAFGVVSAVFPRAMYSWRLRGPAGDSRIEPSRGRLLMMRVMGLVVAAIAVLMAFSPGALV